jgi:hypothetical protein
MGTVVGLYPVVLDDTIMWIYSCDLRLIRLSLWAGQLAPENQSQESHITGMLTQAIVKLGSGRKRTENDV